jgi:hypothetical protein
MNTNSLIEAAHTVFLAIAPLIAGGAIAKIGEDITDVAKETLTKTWTAVGRRFTGSTEATVAVQLYQANPQNSLYQQIVEAQIVDVYKDVPDELLALARAIAALQPTDSSTQGARTINARDNAHIGVVNQGDIAGDAHFGSVDMRQHTQTITGNPTIGTNVAGDLHGNLTIGSLDMSRNKGVPRAAPAPAESLVAAVPRQRIDDPTLSTDGAHFSFGHALIIGVGTYQDTHIRSVSTTANDARALASLLRDPQLAAYPDAQVNILLDAKASRTNILDALEDLANRVHGGTALIFFAGHGEPVGTSYALLPSDTNLKNLAGTALTAEVFHQRVAKVRANAKRLVVMLNCCHAGGVGDAVLGTGAELLSGAAPPADFYRPLAGGSGQVVISSSRPTQKSGAGSKANPQHTPFGAQLLAALRGPAPGVGAGVGIFELFAYLRAQVPTDAKHIWYQGAPLLQEPLFYASQLDDNIPVALRPGWQGGTLSDDTLSLAMRLAELELIAEAGALTPAQVAERDTLLTRLVGGA